MNYRLVWSGGALDRGHDPAQDDDRDEHGDHDADHRRGARPSALIDEVVPRTPGIGAVCVGERPTFERSLGPSPSPKPSLMSPIVLAFAGPVTEHPGWRRRTDTLPA